MPYKVTIKKKVLKRLSKLPKKIQEFFKMLIDDLVTQGPMPQGWKNLSKLGQDEYHCHLDYSWVACWTYVNGSFEIEVYYAGSREDAPY